MKRSPKKHRISIWKRLIVTAIVFLIGAELFYSNNVLTVTRYTVRSPKISSPIRIVFVSDLHAREFGKGNGRLLEKIKAEQPDMIALVGDFFDENTDEEEAARICAFIGEAAELAPVYFGFGNHEWGFMEKRGALTDMIAEAGAKVLECGYEDIGIGGSKLRIGGYSGHYRTPQMDTSDPEKRAQANAFFADFEDTESFKLLLDHIPRTWLDWEYREKYPVDLVLSGHYHGGIARIPLIGKGVFAPNVGWFPPYTKGCFEGEKATCILTTGLAGAEGFPRFFNPPEIVAVEILPESAEQ